WARRLTETGYGLLFLDELTTAPPAVQAAMLRVVLERAVGDVELPAAVRVVAAANPAGQAADGWELASLRRQSDTVAAARLTLSSGVSSEHQRVACRALRGRRAGQRPTCSRALSRTVLPGRKRGLRRVQGSVRRGRRTRASRSAP